MNYHFPETKLKFDLPANCKPGEEVYYNMMLSGVARECSVIYLENVYANRELVLYKNGEMLEVGFAWPWLKDKLYGSLKEKLKFQIKNLLRRKKVVNEPVLWCLDGYSTGGYFHWITDILPRLWMGREYLPEIMFAIPDYFLDRWPFCKDFFKLLGVKNFLIIDNKHKYLLKRLILPTRAGNPFYLQPVPFMNSVRWLRQATLITTGKKFAERIYISRSKANYRKVNNEKDILPVLQKHGFQIIHFEDYSLADQVSICNNAKVLLGLHGAGLTNLVFLPNGSKVIEIRPRNVYHMYNCFFTLCSFFNVEYNYILCDYAPERLASEARIDDHSVLLSPDVLDNELNIIFN